MKRKALSLSEIVEHRCFLPKTTKGVNDWIIAGKIKSTDEYQEQEGYKRIMIATEAIKRLGYE
jgi:hypothetical protein